MKVIEEIVKRTYTDEMTLLVRTETKPLVRCRDCKRGLLEEEKGFHPHVWCRGQCRPDYWFCADGERKEDSTS